MKKYLLALAVSSALPVGAYAQSTVNADWLISPLEAQALKGEEGFNEPPALRASCG